jgi:outer membrane biosynthesis protein TonB
LVSFLAHALLLSVAAGGQAFGLPGFAFPWKERRLGADDLRILLAMTQPGAPAPAPVPAPASASTPANISTAKKSSNPAIASMNEPAVANDATSMRALANPAEPIDRQQLRDDTADAEQIARNETARIEAERLALARQENLRREALRQEQAKEEQERADAARRDAERKELIRQEQARQAQLEAAQLEAMRQAQLEAARQAQLRQEAARIDQAARNEAARMASERRELARQEDLRREALRQERTKQDEQARQDAARRELERAEAAHRESIRQEQARQAQLEAARQAQNQLEAARQEATRQEATRQEREKQEQAQRDRAEQEAQREERLRAIGRQLALEAAQRDAAANRPAGSLPPTGTALRRAWLVGRADPNAPLVQYAEAISRKIERNMTFDMVRDVVKQSHVRPIVTMAIRADGSVEKLTFVVSSGVAAIDEAIRKVVAGQASYGAFPPDLLRQYDVIEIRRTWIFDVAIRLE